MKEVKKETKLIVGISITVILVAIIVTVIVLAVGSAKRGTQLFGTEYVWVEQNENGVVEMRDGLFVAAVDNGYVLAREDKIISKKYAELMTVDREAKLYCFTSFDGFYGILDEKGSEISRVRLSGDFSGGTVGKITKDFVSVTASGGVRTYALPSFAHVEELDGVLGDDVMGYGGQILYKKDGKIKFVGGAEFETAHEMTEAVAAKDGKAVLCGGGYGAYFDGDNVYEGIYGDYGPIKKIDDKLICRDTLLLSPLAADEIASFTADGKTFFFIDGKALYEFTGGELVLKAESAVTTFGDAHFESRRYKGEYETYFTYGDKIYDTDFRVIAEGEGIALKRRNLIKKGTTYTDINGGSVVENVNEFYDVFDFARGEIDEYLYRKDDGIYTTKEKLTLPESLAGDASALRYAFKAENGMYILATDVALICAGDEIAKSDYDDIVLMAESNIALISKTQIRVVKATKRGFEDVSVYGFFGAGLDESYARLCPKTDGVRVGKLCGEGVVFNVGNGKSGFINAKGRFMLSPVYDGITLTSNYMFVKNNGRYAVADFKGKFVTGFSYGRVKALGGFVMCEKTDGTSEILNAKGSNVAQNVVADDLMPVYNYVTRGGKYVIDGDVAYFFVNVGGKYRLVRTFID